MHEMRRYYNLAEANDLVPRLEYLFSELARVQGEVNDLYQAAADSGIEITPERIADWKGLEVLGLPSLPDKLKALSEEYMTLSDEIAGLGVILLDGEQGIVGIYSWFDGQEILLSWQYGEPDVGFWHGVREEPESRRSISELVSFEEIPANLH
jgi:hypothetical protein